jgi:hypothetical protein
MITSVINTKRKITSYPCLKTNNLGMIILFTSENTGTVIVKDNLSIWSLGYYSTAWNETSFKNFQGSITISQ